MPVYFIAKFSGTWFVLEKPKSNLIYHSAVCVIYSRLFQNSTRADKSGKITKCTRPGHLGAAETSCENTDIYHFLRIYDKLVSKELTI